MQVTGVARLGSCSTTARALDRPIRGAGPDTHSYRGHMTHHRRITTFALVLCALAACGGDVTTAPGPTAKLIAERDTDTGFQTDSLAYTLRAGRSGYETRIAAVFTNRSASTVYIVNCGGATAVSLEKLVGDQWQRVWSPVIPACLSQPITVPAGGTWRTELWVFGGYPGSNSYPQFEVADPAGVYRAVWHGVLISYQDRLPFGEPLPLPLRASNRFTLAVQR